MLSRVNASLGDTPLLSRRQWRKDTQTEMILAKALNEKEFAKVQKCDYRNVASSK